MSDSPANYSDLVDQLEYTSERINPDWYQGSRADYLIYLFHIASYNFARQYTADRTVLDYGCGTGYGTAMLAESANRVTGIDIVAEVIEHAQAHYKNPKLDFQLIPPAESGALPYEDHSFDTVVSFQVIEHLKDVDSYLSEIERVLRPGGQFVSATPDRSTRLFDGQRPWNMHHVTEFSADQLCEALSGHFDDVEIFGMKADPEVIAIELSRARRMKWMLLPFTLPMVPESIRQFGLRTAKRSLESIRKRDSNAAVEFDFDESAIQICPHTPGCVILVAVAQKNLDNPNHDQQRPNRDKQPVTSIGINAEIPVVESAEKAAIGEKTELNISHAKPLWKTVLHGLGALFAIGSLAWYGYALYAQLDVFRELRFNRLSVGAIAIGVAVYPLIYAIAAYTWAIALRCLKVRLPIWIAVKVSFVAQFGKYLPGNVAHHVARVVMAKKYGASARHVVLSMIIETICLIIGGILVALGALAVSPMLRTSFQHWLPTQAWVVGILTVTTIAGALAVLAGFHFFKRIRQMPDTEPRWLLHCLGLTFVVFFLHGVIAQAILVGVFGVDTVSLAAVTGLFALAWVIGFVTPGAPAGIGVREAVLAVGMESVCGLGVAVGLAALLRLVSALGDGLTFAIGMWLSRFK